MYLGFAKLVKDFSKDNIILSHDLIDKIDLESISDMSKDYSAKYLLVKTEFYGFSLEGPLRNYKKEKGEVELVFEILTTNVSPLFNLSDLYKFSIFVGSSTDNLEKIFDSEVGIPSENIQISILPPNLDNNTSYLPTTIVSLKF